MLNSEYRCVCCAYIRIINAIVKVDSKLLFFFAGGKNGLSASSSRSTSPLGQGTVSFIPRAPSSSG